MKILLDTNVLISALVFGGVPRQMIMKILLSNHDLYVSDYVEKELFEKIHMKWSDKAEHLIAVYKKMELNHCNSTKRRVGNIRDEKDVPVLSDAIENGIDIIISGDLDLLEADLEKPLVYSPRMMLDYLSKGV